MKEGRSLISLAAELKRQKETKHDYIADTNKLELVAPDGGSITLNMELPHGETIFNVSNFCHTQIGQHVKIPKPYYERMLHEAPGLLAQNVNHWFTDSPAPRMVRTLDNNARAFLSNKYRPLDNVDLMEAVYPSLEQTGLQVQSCELTDTRMYIKAVSEKVEGEVKKGDVVRAGVVISNSEVGSGALSIQPLLYRLVCLNGMIRADEQMRRVHTGSRHTNNDSGSWELYSTHTKRQSDLAVFMQARDLAKAFLQQEFFERMLEDLRRAAEDNIESKDLGKVIDVTSKTLALTEDEGHSVLDALIRDGDLSRWGLANAITSAAQDVEDYDRATELEALGGQIIEMKQTDWAKIAAA